MDEYIERDKIRESYEKLTRSYVHDDPYIADWRFDEMIESLPAADVAPVRHGRWIPVTERLPKLIPSSAGTGYSEAVNVLTSGRKVITAIYDGTDWIGSFRFWDAEGEEITHWAPVLLPLPEPQKEDAR